MPSPCLAARCSWAQSLRRVPVTGAMLARPCVSRGSNPLSRGAEVVATEGARNLLLVGSSPA